MYLQCIYWSGHASDMYIRIDICTIRRFATSIQYRNVFLRNVNFLPASSKIELIYVKCIGKLGFKLFYNKKKRKAMKNNSRCLIHVLDHGGCHL